MTEEAQQQDCPRCRQRAVDYYTEFEQLVCGNCDWMGDAKPSAAELTPDF